jgi:uncharacterized protein (DUF1697 family)
MPVVISMLRGVNVGGQHHLEMNSLRTLYASLDLLNAQTYIQSGNVVFATQESDLPRLATRIESAIERSAGFRPNAILRTVPEMTSVIERNPFAARPDLDPAKLLITFLARDPGPQARGRLRTIPAGPEELHFKGREVYTYFPNGIGKAKLSPALLERLLNIASTGRNWNTVTKLLEMARALEASLDSAA